MGTNPGFPWPGRRGTIPSGPEGTVTLRLMIQWQSVLGTWSRKVEAGMRRPDREAAPEEPTAQERAEHVFTHMRRH